MKTRSPENEVDRVRSQTSPESLKQIDQRIEDSISFHATQDSSAISKRIAELESEWSIERYLETNASAIVFTSTVLGLTVNKRWFVVPLLVTGFLFQHAVQGWCPPLPALRKLGVRTRGEIDREKYALKILRGDFKSLNAKLSNQLKTIRGLIAEINAAA